MPVTSQLQPHQACPTDSGIGCRESVTYNCPRGPLATPSGGRTRSGRAIKGEYGRSTGRAQASSMLVSRIVRGKRIGPTRVASGLPHVRQTGRENQPSNLKQAAEAAWADHLLTNHAVAVTRTITHCPVSDWRASAAQQRLAVQYAPARPVSANQLLPQHGPPRQLCQP